MTPLRVYMVGAFDPDYPRHKIIRTGLERVGVEVVSAVLPLQLNTIHLVPQVFAHWREARQCDVIFVPTFNQLLAPFIYLLGRILRRPVVVDYMVGLTDAIVEERHVSPSRKATLYRMVDRFNLRQMVSLTDTAAHRAEYIRLAALSAEHMPLYWIKLAGNDLSAMHILPVGVYDTWYSPQPLPTHDGVLVQFFGSYIPFHGVEVIVETAVHFLDDPRVRFELIGRGQTYAAIRQYTDALGLSNVTFVDPILPDELPRRVVQADICLGVFGTHPKTDYAVPNKVFQCMAMGRPVITAEAAAVREFFTPGQDLITIPPGNANALAAAIRALIESPDRRAQLGASAARRICSSYLPQHVGARLKTILEQSIGRPVSA